MELGSYLFASDVCRVSWFVGGILHNTRNEYNNQRQWRDVLPAKKPEDVWSTSSHVLNVIGKTRTKQSKNCQLNLKTKLKDIKIACTGHLEALLAQTSLGSK